MPPAGAVTFYRVISLDEWIDYQNCGYLRAGVNSMEGKHLTDHASVRFFAKNLYGSTPHTIISITVDQVIADKFFKLGRIDACGPSWFAEIDDLWNAVVVREDFV